MDVRYEIPDFKIDPQELTKDDIKQLLAKEVITLFSLVKRTTESTAMPLVSHPDFEDDWSDQTMTPPSKNLTNFLEKLEEMKNNSQSSKNTNS